MEKQKETICVHCKNKRFDIYWYMDEDGKKYLHKCCADDPKGIGEIIK